MQGTWVQSLVREIRSHVSCGAAKKKKKIGKNNNKVKGEFTVKFKFKFLPIVSKFEYVCHYDFLATNINCI